MAPNRPFPVDPTLTAISIGYRNPAHVLIGRRVLPPLPVLQEEFKWTEYPLAEGFTVPDLKVARTGQPGQVQFTGEERTSSVDDYGLDHPIPYSDIEVAARARAEQRSLIDPEAMAAQGIANYLELGREIRAATLVQDAANYSEDRKVTLEGTDQWSDLDDSDPVGDIDEALHGTLVYRANVVAMGYDVWNVLKRAPKMVKHCKGTTDADGFVSREQFAAAFDLRAENVLIGEGYLNAAKPGQPVALQRVWGKKFAALYIDPSKQSATDGVLTYGFTAEFGTRISGSIEDRDIGVKGGKRVRVGESVKECVVAKDLGYLISSAVA